MNELLRWDYRAHFCVGVGVSLTGYALLSAWVPKVDPLWVSIGTTMLLGAAKEGVDSLGFGSADVFDFIFTALGSLAGAWLGHFVVGRK